jgi:3-oxoacyl-[acyl-carrier-protein] synthase II
MHMSSGLGVLGIGVVSARGRGPDGHATPVDTAMESLTPAPRVYRVHPDTLKDRVALKKLRRADHFSKMAALSAWDAVSAAGLSPGTIGPELGIIVTTAFGPHQTTFEFLDELLDFGDANVSPTRFSHSVHNAAAAYIAMMLDGRGPACTVADFDRPLYAGLLTAAAWLQERRCTRVCVTYTEEWSAPMEYIATTRREDGMRHLVQPFHFSPDPQADLSEGSVCLVLAEPDEAGPVLAPAQFDGANRIATIETLLSALASAY